MLAGFIGFGVILVCAIVVIIGSGGVNTPPNKTDKDARDLPGYLD